MTLIEIIFVETGCQEMERERKLSQENFILCGDFWNKYVARQLKR